MLIEPYKGRELPRVGDRVRVYRNLNRPGVVYSVLVGGLVVGHTNNIVLAHVRFIVQEAGRRRALKMGRRNVHAFAEGTFEGGAAVALALAEGVLPATVSYTPVTGWVAQVPEQWGAREIRVTAAGCLFLHLSARGAYAFGEIQTIG